MNKTKFLILGILVVLISGCTMAPKYERPENAAPGEWPKGAAYTKNQPEDTALPASSLSWQSFITDVRLQKILETALANNRDLRITALNVERAGAMYGINRASLLPSVNVAGSWYKGADLSSSGTSATAERYDISLGAASWEIDFFGRIRSLKDKALEEYLATQQGLQASQILLVSSVAQAYLTLAADREALKLVSKTLATQEASYQLIQKHFHVGLISDLDIQRAKSQVDMARGGVARYTHLVAQDENALNLLVGSPVKMELLPQDLSDVRPPRDISPGLSSEPLFNRPDILAAEHRLRAANANIGAARAAIFPRISLTTSVGTASTELSGLFKSGSGVWAFAPQIVAPIFDPRIWYAYDVTKIEKEMAVAQYEKTVQTAFREVADALAVKGTIDDQINAQQALVEDYSATYRLSVKRYEKGIDSYLAVLDAQRSQYAAELALIMLRLARSNNLITLYRTLGGNTVGKDNVSSRPDSMNPLPNVQVDKQEKFN
ncbi:MAG TPA: efflux transporter outer membrane subunit [Smithellaceae bacterium]|jgi:outer membrane protein, multidrug efflux system|nr:efflux transporter outer membrane subunit [Smithellaceae bacterium]HQM45140.1 efflux transporter outer membrane subunit [Smithellaceae bacterium]